MAIATSGSLTGSQLQIGIALVLHDRFSNEARTVSKELRTLHKEAKQAVLANLNMASTIIDGAGSLISGFAEGMAQAVLESNEFIDTMVTVGAITSATEEQLQGLKDTAQTLGLDTLFSSIDIASGMKYLAMAGNTADEINGMIRGAAMVAGATGMELAGKGGAADLITNVMRMFKIEAADAATVVGDQLTKATLSANMSMTDLAEAIKYAGADVVTLGQKIPQVAALIGVLGNAGIQGSMAGTAIGNMARYLNKSISDPNYTGAKILAMLGLSKADFINAKGELEDFALIVGKIRDAMLARNMSPVDISSTMRSIFGVRGNRAAIALMNDLEGYNDLFDKIMNSTGYASEIMEKRMNSLAGATDIFVNAIQNLKTTFTEALEPTLRPILLGLAKMLQFIRDILATPLGPVIASVTMFGTVIAGVGLVVAKLKVGLLTLASDSLVSFRAMFNILRSGWTKASISASQYLTILEMIKNQNKYGNFGALNEMVRNGQVVNGVIFNPKTGRYHDATTHSFISNREAGRRLSGAPNPGFFSKLVGGSGKGLGGIGRALGLGLGFLGGPVGIALTGISIALPLIISALNKNKETVEKNTYSVATLAGKYETEQERIAARKSLRLSEEAIAAGNYMRQAAQEFREATKNINEAAEKISNSRFTVTQYDNHGRRISEEVNNFGLK